MGLFSRWFGKSEDLRPPSFAGMLYPEDAHELREAVGALLAEAEAVDEPAARGLIVPYSELAFSGPVAASGYVHLPSDVTRVVILGPSQRVPFRGVVVPSADGLSTPLGKISIAAQLRQELVESGRARVLDVAFDPEPSVELQLPFLQMRLESFEVLPMLVGDCRVEDLVALLERVWRDGSACIFATELSQDREHDAASSFDRETAEILERLAVDELTFGRVTARSLVRAGMTVAAARGQGIRTVDLRTSGDTQGVEGLVAGYGAFVIEDG